MAIITAPVLRCAGRDADWGCFCRGCREEKDETGRRFRVKNTSEEIVDHILELGPVVEMTKVPGRFYT